MSQPGQTPLEQLTDAAERGDARAQYVLGLMHANGDGVDLSYQRAAEWLLQAAEQGFAGAQSMLGWLYANGYGVSQDDAEARRWYLAAAESGQVKAQYVAATMYRFGQFGVERDMAKAIEWYQSAAAQGLSAAQYALGKLLFDGKHVAPDDTAALQWFTLAHVNGSKRAQGFIDLLLKRMKPEDVLAVRDATLGQGGDKQ